MSNLNSCLLKSRVAVLFNFMCPAGTTGSLLLSHQIEKIKSVCYKIYFLGHLFMMKADLLLYTRKFIDWKTEKQC